MSSSRDHSKLTRKEKVISKVATGRWPYAEALEYRKERTANDIRAEGRKAGLSAKDQNQMVEQAYGNGATPAFWLPGSGKRVGKEMARERNPVYDQKCTEDDKDINSAIRSTGRWATSSRARDAHAYYGNRIKERQEQFDRQISNTDHGGSSDDGCRIS